MSTLSIWEDPSMKIENQKLEEEVESLPIPIDTHLIIGEYLDMNSLSSAAMSSKAFLSSVNTIAEDFLVKLKKKYPNIQPQGSSFSDLIKVIKSKASDIIVQFPEKIEIVQNFQARRDLTPVQLYKKLDEVQGEAAAFLHFARIITDTQHTRLELYDTSYDANARFKKFLNNIFNVTYSFELTNSEKFERIHQILNENSEVLENIYSLKISRTELRYLPSEISFFKNLQKLDLNFNQIKKLPREIGNLFHLEHLSLFKNRLESIPQTLGNLKKLKTLDLTTNCLREIPNNLEFFSSLKTLKLAANRIEKLPENLSCFDIVKMINLGGNLLTELPEGIGNLPNLEILEIRNNQIGKFPDQLEKIETLDFLDLSQNPIDDFPLELKNVTFSGELNKNDVLVGDLIYEKPESFQWSPIK